MEPEPKSFLAQDSDSFQSAYDILGVSVDATQSEIASAYRKKARNFHPDSRRALKVRASGGYSAEKSLSMFRSIKEAYEKLKDARSRQIYDISGDYGYELYTTFQQQGFGETFAMFLVEFFEVMKFVASHCCFSLLAVSLTFSLLFNIPLLIVLKAQGFLTCTWRMAFIPLWLFDLLLFSSVLYFILRYQRLLVLFPIICVCLLLDIPFLTKPNGILDVTSIYALFESGVARLVVWTVVIITIPVTFFFFSKRVLNPDGLTADAKRGASDKEDKFLLLPKGKKENHVLPYGFEEIFFPMLGGAGRGLFLCEVLFFILFHVHIQEKLDHLWNPKEGWLLILGPLIALCLVKIVASCISFYKKVVYRHSKEKSTTFFQWIQEITISLIYIAGIVLVALKLDQNVVVKNYSWLEILLPVWLIGILIFSKFVGTALFNLCKNKSGQTDDIESGKKIPQGFPGLETDPNANVTVGDFVLTLFCGLFLVGWILATPILWSLSLDKMFDASAGLIVLPIFVFLLLCCYLLPCCTVCILAVSGIDSVKPKKSGGGFKNRKD